MEKNPSSSSSSSSSASSTIADLFGPNPSLSSSSSSSPSVSSSSIFGSVFGPPYASMGRGRDSTSQVGNVKHGSPENGAQNNKGGSSKNSNYYQQETIDPPFSFSSSIYYGGREDYSPTTRPTESHFKKDGLDDDPNSASRGNWWQGSLYY